MAFSSTPLALLLLLLTLGRFVDETNAFLLHSRLALSRHAAQLQPQQSFTGRPMGFTVTFGGKDDDNWRPPPYAPHAIIDSMISNASRALKRVSWLSWWAQVILTTITAVALGFSRKVVAQSNAATNFVLPACSICLSIASILWTWANGWRLSQRIMGTTLVQAATLMRRAIRVGVTLNLVGLLLSLLGAEQIVGVLAIKVLTTQSAGMGGALDLLQPLDILIVQSNTNLLLSHFVSLVSLLWLTNPLERLDPPAGKRSR